MQHHKQPGYVPAYLKYKQKEAAAKSTRRFLPKPVTRAGFQKRDELLREMGFANYAEYLKSELWYAIRRRAMRRTGGQCVCCGHQATLIHHCEYTRDLLLGRGTLRRLWPLCNDCHRLTHTREVYSPQIGQTEVGGSDATAGGTGA